MGRRAVGARGPLARAAGRLLILTVLSVGFTLLMGVRPMMAAAAASDLRGSASGSIPWLHEYDGAAMSGRASEGAWPSDPAALTSHCPAIGSPVAARSPSLVATDATAGSGLSEAFHYTSVESAQSIVENGARPGLYATPNGELSPLQAQLELSLNPEKALPTSAVRIDVGGLRSAGFDIPSVTRVSGVVPGEYSVYTMPGGGFEMQFPYAIPSEFLSVVGGG